MAITTPNKTCSRCRAEKPLENFDRCSRRRDGRRSECKSCRKEDSARYYASLTPVEKTQRWQKQRRPSALYVLDYLKVHPCGCGETDPAVLDFDHLRDKTAAVSYLVQCGYSVERVAEEIEKCEVVCANCHRRRTAKRAGWYQWL